MLIRCHGSGFGSPSWTASFCCCCFPACVAQLASSGCPVALKLRCIAAVSIEEEEEEEDEGGAAHQSVTPNENESRSRV